MKYVMLKRKMETLTQYVPVIFPHALVHDEVATALMRGPLKDFEVHSAGEASLFNGEISVSGDSKTLGVEHDEADEYRMRMADYGGLLE